MTDLIVQVLTWTLAIASAPLLFAVLVFATQAVAAALPAPARVPRTEAFHRPRIAVLIPAHDEASGIARTLDALRPQLHPGDAMLVVADNCTDDTAAVARAAGATVVERRHDTLRGKGFALAFGVDALRADPPGMVVIVDADCEVAPGGLDALAARLAATQRPVQALYLMLAPDDAGLARRLAQFAWRVRNWVRPAGWRRLGLPCQLMGTGMAFGWPMLREAALANASIVEDMKLGIDLALAGRPPVFCAEALVTSWFPQAAAATRTQRTRWEHGHLEMILREVPAMLGRGLARRDGKLLGMALDLFVPPLALLAASQIAATLAAALLWALSGAPALFAVEAVFAAVFLGAVLLAWAVRGRDLVRARELLSIPFYIGAKVPIYLRFLVRRQKNWVRTDRDAS